MILIHDFQIENYSRRTLRYLQKPTELVCVPWSDIASFVYSISGNSFDRKVTKKS